MDATPRRRRADIAETLRRRIVAAVSAGASRRGDRLPSAREVAAEFEADPRLVLAAYRILAREGLVSIRRRSGIYVAAVPEVAGGPPVVAPGWLVDTLAGGIEQGVAASKLGEWLRRCVSTRKVRVAVVAGSDDQLETFCGELRDDYGFDAVPFAPEAIDRPGGAPPEMLNADFVAAPEPHAAALRRALPDGARVVTLEPRADIDAVWRREMRRGPVYVVVSDPRTLALMERSFSAAAAVHPMVLGRDDIATIPDDAGVYLSRAARRRLDGQAMRFRVLPSTRAFTPKTARELLGVLVEANLAAMQR
ncbi:GntR family transcriptional regulator [Roseisolibacter sp. H3M3-2]|uniref:GntR family transcriptional regulator n=1 Tax=Roseisolibacter sp. H3M3-2 TaxID=3031323 RepID=UPI0023DB7E58|nr:GntR family transcriptional regulator [Roseisolibacter sp. H3M3-2]MDF1502617.1 GntR family transcriptional regulator [Roseisolibacter sp. H3M3-2]